MLTSAQCCKLSTLPTPIREVPVRHTRALRSTEQLGLFHPRATTPRWMDLPAEVQQQILCLLARLLRRHRAGLRVEGQVQEARDE